eukprot:TRINITY_DN10094_c0_g1_i1.p1 TRINITY_DN10094_c0_g1~~TRINITY_DN10094_c0_g1_i1.p1  ORF type:complete len:368 (-),score=79.43 TRINITY_DN10094_c0_g1_i1:287-1390(-)
MAGFGATVAAHWDREVEMGSSCSSSESDSGSDYDAFSPSSGSTRSRIVKRGLLVAGTLALAAVVVRNVAPSGASTATPAYQRDLANRAHAVAAAPAALPAPGVAAVQGAAANPALAAMTAAVTQTQAPQVPAGVPAAAPPAAAVGPAPGVPAPQTAPAAPALAQAQAQAQAQATAPPAPAVGNSNSWMPPTPKNQRRRPLLKPSEHLHDGNVCDDTEELYDGLCYTKCSTLLGIPEARRSTSFSCCPTSDCHGNVFKMKTASLIPCQGYDVSSQDGGKACPHIRGECLTDEEQFMGECFEKCEKLTNGKFPKRIAAATCCNPDGQFGCWNVHNDDTNANLNVGGGAGDHDGSTPRASHFPLKYLTER